MVLPEPDSPTTPSVSPLRTDRLTPSTALICPTVERSRPRLTGNQTFRSSADITTGDSGRGGAGIGLRFGGEQCAGVGMFRRGEDLLHRPLLDDLAAVHDADHVRDAAHDAEIVGDEQQAHAEPAANLREQRQDLRLHGDVERRGRLIRDQQIGLVGERHRDHDALALAAG